MKKLFCSLIMVLGMVVAVSAQKSGRIIVPESKLEFEFNSDWTEVTITGCDRDYFTNPNLKGKTLEIPSKIQEVPVTRIGYDYGYNAVFYSGSYGIWIPDTVKSIGDMAFEYTYFTSIHLPEGLEKIGNFCFSSCNAKTINIPSTVKYIGSFAFRDCGIESVTIPEDCEIRGSAFRRSGLKKITFPKGRVYFSPDHVGDWAQFGECDSLEIIETPKELQLLHNYSADCTLLDYMSGKK